MSRDSDCQSTELGALLHLASPVLPIGGFSYSQALEAAIHHGLITDAADAHQWIEGHLFEVMTKSEALIWIYLYNAWQAEDVEKISYWNDWFWASRETSEFRLETEQMGWSLVKLIKELAWGTPDQHAVLIAMQTITLPCAHTFACHTNGIQVHNGLHIYLYTWLENQVMAAMKGVPLGQVAGQKILLSIGRALASRMNDILTHACAEGTLVNTFAPQLNILSSRHEHQYSRLFRS